MSGHSGSEEGPSPNKTNEAYEANEANEDGKPFIYFIKEKHDAENFEDFEALKILKATRTQGITNIPEKLCKVRKLKEHFSKASWHQEVVQRVSSCHEGRPVEGLVCPTPWRHH